MMPKSGLPATVPWVPVIGLAFSQLVAWGVLYYAFAVIVTPMGAELGWTKPQMHGAQSLGLLISGVSAYAVGRRIDRHGGRGLMMAGAVLGGIAVLLWSQVTALWQLYAVFVLIGAASAMALYEAAFAVTAKLAPSHYRRAITAITLVAGLASTASIPLTHVLTEVLGWRNCLAVLAVAEMTLCAAVPWLVLPVMPAARARKPEPEPTPSVVPKVVRNPVFWLLLASYVSFSFFYTSLLFSLLPMLAERGFTAAAAVALYALIGPSQVVGRLCVFATERFVSLRFAGVLATIMPMAAMLILLGLTPQSDFAFAFAILFGAGMGIKTVVQATAAPDFLGIRQYGALQGLLTMPVQLVQAAAPFVAALLYQWSGGYGALSRVLFACVAISALAFSVAAWKSRSAGLRPVAS